jgi:hypothetical protein
LTALKRRTKEQIRRPIHTMTTKGMQKYNVQKILEKKPKSFKIL